MRSEPGESGRVLKTLAEGTPVDVLGPEGEVDGQIWRQVRDPQGVTGWLVRGAVVPPGTVPTPGAPGNLPIIIQPATPLTIRTATPRPQ
jgi:hypothetical protein